MLSPAIILAVSVVVSILVGLAICQLNAGFRSCVNCFIDSFHHGMVGIYFWYFFVGTKFIILLFLFRYLGQILSLPLRMQAPI